jgi:hypothetical protein
MEFSLDKGSRGLPEKAGSFKNYRSGLNSPPMAVIRGIFAYFTAQFSAFWTFRPVFQVKRPWLTIIY